MFTSVEDVMFSHVDYSNNSGFLFIFSGKRIYLACTIWNSVQACVFACEIQNRGIFVSFINCRRCHVESLLSHDM